MDWLNNNAGAIQGISTVILVLVTIYYAIQARKSVIEIKKQRDLTVMPTIIPESFSLHSGNKDHVCVDCNLENIGNGPARNINIEFINAENKNFLFRSVHKIDFLKCNEKEILHAHFPKKKLENIRYKAQGKDLAAYLIAKIKYNDFGNNEYETTKEFHLDKKSLNMAPVEGTLHFR